MFALIWTLFILAAVWLLLVRPQRRRVVEHAALVAALDVGHRVVTAGGIHGRIEAIEDDVVRLEVAPGTVIRVERRAVARDLDATPDVTVGEQVPDETGDE